MIIVLVLHIVIAIFLVGMILIQKNEGGLGGLGGGSGSGGMGGFLAGRTQANLLTRTTAILAAAFFITSLALAIVSSHGGTSHLVPDLTSTPGGGSATLPAGIAPVVPAPAAPSDAGSAPASGKAGSDTTGGSTTPAAPAPAAPAGQ